LELIEKGILVVAIHPGWVKTRMGGDNAILPTHDSVASMISTMEKLDVNSNGQFLNFDGKEIPW